MKTAGLDAWRLIQLRPGKEEGRGAGNQRPACACTWTWMAGDGLRVMGRQLLAWMSGG